MEEVEEGRGWDGRGGGKQEEEEEKKLMAWPWRGPASRIPLCLPPCRQLLSPCVLMVPTLGVCDMPLTRNVLGMAAGLMCLL